MQFAKIIGQHALANKLTQIIDTGRISHAQLFLGNSGYGSLPLAIAYAQYLNCTNRIHFSENEGGNSLLADSCGKCPSCVKYERLEHPDLHFIFPNTTTTKVKSNNSSDDFQADFRTFLKEKGFYCDLSEWFDYFGIDNKLASINVRDAANILQKMSYKSYESKFKVVVLWMVEKLYYQAAPKLLKILEEPSEGTLFLLVSENQDKILKTILSRTQLVKVTPIATTDLKNYLQSQLAVSPTDAERASIMAGGNFNEAQNILNKSDINYLFSNLFVRWMRLSFKIEMFELNKWVEEMAALGREVQKQFMKYCLQQYQNCVLLTYNALSSNSVIDFGDQRFNTSFPKMISERNIAEIEKKVNDTIYAIERNANPKILFLSLSFDMAKLLKSK